MNEKLKFYEIEKYTFIYNIEIRFLMFPSPNTLLLLLKKKFHQTF